MRRALLSVCVLLATSPSAFALNPALDITQYGHASWKNRDGFATGAIWAIAQTPDGYLWLGTDTGLLRFDGLRSVPWSSLSNQRLPSDEITGLLAAVDGTLWIGTPEGLVAWKSGRLTSFEKLAGHRISKIVEDSDGSIWVSAALRSRFLCAIHDGRVTCYGEDGGPGADAIGLYQNRKRELWVGTFNGLWKWKPGPPRFHAVPADPDGIQGITEDGDGTILYVYDGAVRRLTDGRSEIAYAFPDALRRAGANRLLRDRDGGLWIGTSSLGLMHAHGGKIEALARGSGLTADGIYSLFEDREGNVWAGTIGGLERFRDVAVATVSVDQGLPSERINSVVAGEDGTLWMGTPAGVVKWRNGREAVYRDPGAPAVLSMLEDRHHRLWLATLRGISRLEHDRLVPIAGLPGDITRGIGEDGEHTVWIANVQHGLFQVLADGKTIVQTPWIRLGSGEAATAMTTRLSEGGVWLGFDRGRVVHFSNGQIRASYGATDGIGNGAVTSLQFDRDGVLWAATDGGLVRIDAGRVSTLARADGLPCDSTKWTLEDNDRSLWVGTRCGLVRMTRSDLDAWVASAGRTSTAVRPIHATLFDTTDGALLFASSGYYSMPTARTSDGTVWFLAVGGVGVVDPRHLPSNSQPPPVHVEDVIADRQVFGASAAIDGRIHLPALTRDVRIDYTALSLGAPEKVRFRYKLEGQDSDWQAVGTRRQAFYNDLRPGSYRFHVIASDEGGRWKEAVASVELVMAPAYYQTIWFRTLVVTMLLTLIWAAHRVRLRFVEKHEREISALNERLMKAQERERIRIAGELHDGVMQQMLSMSMMLGSAKRRVVNQPSEATATIEKVQQKLVQAGSDIRQLSHGLHPPILQEAGLPAAVRSYCDEFSVARGIRVTCDADETVHELSRGAALALFRILQEALGNAAKHGQAKRVTVRLTRTNGEVALTVSDDGVGFAAGGSGAGGLGLVMMRERATQLSGTFHLASATGRGTTISVAIPFR